MLTTIISFIIVLGVLIFIHEFGHYIVAKYYGVKVEEFALGFGPKLISRKKGETVYSIRAIPLGGFCNMTGEFVPDDDQDEEEREIYEEAKKQGKCFHQKSIWERFAIIFMGPFMNFMLAIFIYILIFSVFGYPMDYSNQPIIGEVVPGQPASEAGLRPGDEITAINGQSVETWDDMSSIIHESENEIKIEYVRDDQKISKNITPELAKQEDNYVIGIYPALIRKPVGIKAVWLGLEQTGYIFYMTFSGFFKMITRQSPAEVGGPVMIASIIGNAARTGVDRVLQWMAVISINLGIINLFPIPALDGGRIIFLILELVRGKPVNPERESMVHFIGFVLLMILMVFIIYQDIMRSIF